MIDRRCKAGVGDSEIVVGRGRKKLIESLRPISALQFRKWLPAGAVLVLCLTLTEASLHLVQRSQIAESSSQASTFAAQVRGRLESELNNVIHLSSGLSSYFMVNASSLDDAEISELLEVLYRHTRHVRNLGVAVGYILKYVTPLDGNSKAIGLDYRELPDQLPGVQATIDAGRPDLTPRIDLVQGGHGVIYRAPIFLDNQYWGMLSTVIDIESLLRSALSDLSLSNIEFSVHDKGEKKALLWGVSATSPAGVTHEVSTEFGWKIVVYPQLSQSQITVGIGFRILGWFCSIFACLGAQLFLSHRRQLIHMSRHDPLTQLSNRRAFDERLELECARLKRDPDRGFAVAIIDLDGFKPINDLHGHATGDVVLGEIARRLQAATRQTDLVSRWGGDEFGVLLDVADDRSVLAMEHRLSACFVEPVRVDQLKLCVGGSIGIVTAPRDGNCVHQLLTAADDMMYASKRRRKDDETGSVSQVERTLAC